MNSLEGDSEFPGGSGGAASSSGGGQDPSEALQGHSLSEAAEAQVQAVLGDLEASKRKYLRRELNPLASPGQARRDLTISSLIAECEEYVKTDEFTKDLSDNLVHLFSQNKSNPSHVSSSKTHTDPESRGSVTKPNTEKVSKPPKVPENMRSSKLNGKSDAVVDKHEKDSSSLPKFPVSVRSSTYDNVGAESEEVEDEGIDNDYDEAEAGDSGNMMVRCGSQEGSPALTSEGYDSAHESGELDDVLLTLMKFPNSNILHFRDIS